MAALNQPETSLKYLELLSEKFPTQQAAFSEIINLQAILNLPKGTEHFMSDVHGEYEAFLHILNNCSGVVREHVDEILPQLSFEEKGELCTLIYYPRQKIELIKSQHLDSPMWYKTQLNHLITVARALSSRYTRSKVRKAIPRDYAYIIDELLHTHPDENNYRVRYHERIIESVLETGAADEFIYSLARLIKRLAVDHLHLVGDIYDRGGGASKIMDRLMGYHSLDIQWGNHDLLWMGAAAGSAACVLNAVRNSIRYNNFEILENDYGISLRALTAFAEHTYAPPSPEEEAAGLDQLSKAINVMLFKLEGQVMRRHPEFGMNDRLLLEKIDAAAGTVQLPDGSTYKLVTRDFPTLDAANPYELSPEEQQIVDRLVAEFGGAGHLQRHIDFLYQHGSMYLAYNNNLMFHGCIPMEEDGGFSAVNCLDNWYSGRAYLDFCDSIARRAWRERDTDALDWMWYLWNGSKSPASGRIMKTFERCFVADNRTWHEPMDPYFALTHEEDACNAVLAEFGMPALTGHIVNGHTPVKTTKGEVPIRANGKLLVIDGGFCSAYHPTTGIAGYTLISSSRGCRLKSHRAFSTIEEALTRNVDIKSETQRFDVPHERRMVADTDTGAEIRAQIDDLRQLLAAYREGRLQERK